MSLLRSTQGDWSSSSVVPLLLTQDTVNSVSRVTLVPVTHSLSGSYVSLDRLTLSHPTPTLSRPDGSRRLVVPVSWTRFSQNVLDVGEESNMRREGYMVLVVRGWIPKHRVRARRVSDSPSDDEE